jgi:hypothetical protein
MKSTLNQKFIQALKDALKNADKIPTDELAKVIRPFAEDIEKADTKQFKKRVIQLMPEMKI